MKKLGLLLASSIIVQGCTFNGIPSVSGDLENEELKFIGIPLLMGSSGSTVRLNEEWVITVAHNEQIIFEDLYKHKNCDIALYKDPIKHKKELTMAKTPKKDEKIEIKGYAGALAIPSKSKGVYIEPLQFGDCLMGITNAPVMSGMSGGGVYTHDGKLVGITQAVLQKIKLDEGSMPIREGFRRRSLFVPICTEQVKDWVYETTQLNICE